MITYLIRLIRSRLSTFTLSILALALAIASLTSCLSIYKSIQSGNPIGTHYQGDVVSLFTRLSSYNLSFFLKPSQIINLQLELNDNGHIIAASGGRYKPVQVAENEIKSVIDTVSENFFDVLKIDFIQGSSQGFSGDEPVCLLSSAYIQKNNLTPLPKQLILAGKSYKVLGEVKYFKGLLDAETDIWIPWQHGHNVMFPSLKDRGLLRQPGLYRTIIISNNQNSHDFYQAVEQLKQRTDLLLPPEDGYISVKGITRSEKKHTSASQSTQLYLYISLLIFVVAVLNLSTWVSLTRSSKLNDELTFLKLGINYKTYFSYHLFLILLPIIMAFILAIPFYYLYLSMLQQEPAIADLLLYSTEYKSPKIWGDIGMMFASTLILTYGLSTLIAKACGVGFSSQSFKQISNRLKLVFRTMLLMASSLASISLIFSLFTLQYGVKTLSVFTVDNSQSIYYLVRDSSKEELSVDKIKSFMNILKQENPGINNVGLIQFAPTFSLSQTQGFSLKQYTDPDISIIVNSITQETLPALGVKRLKGEGLSDISANQLVVDTKLEKKLIELTGNSSVLGLKLYDAASDAFVIVGIVSDLNYADDPTNQLLASYTNYNAGYTRGIIVFDGDINVEAFQSKLTSINNQFSMNYSQIKSYHQLQLDKRKPYVSRLMLCLIAAIISVIISLITIFAIANIDIAQRKNNLAIYSALGLSPFKLWWQANRMLTFIVIMGAIAGSLLFWYTRNNSAIQLITQGSNWGFTFITAFVIVLVIAIISISLAFTKLFYNKPLFNYLRNND